MSAKYSKTVHGRMAQVVQNIQHWLALYPNPGEAVVRQTIVLPLLQAAGFDIWNPAEVIPEETDKGGFRPDLLVVAGEHRFVLELKGMNVGLHDKDYQQVASYAGSKGIRWALLTDGRVWIFIDEDLKGAYTNRVVLKLELVQHDAGVFAEDISAVLDAETWKSGAFELSVLQVRQAQQSRLDAERICREKRPIIEEVRREFGIATFAQAASAAVQMGRITEAERDVLLSAEQSQLSSPAAPESEKLETRESKGRLKMRSIKATKQGELTLPAPSEIRFLYRPGQADAQAVYFPALGRWVVQAGSIASAEIKEYATDVTKRRQAMLEAGQLEVLEDGRLRYVQDFEYHHPSRAAADVSGGSKNGWDVWMDEQGRPAQYHRPPKS